MFYVFTAPSIKIEPIDEYETDHMVFAMPQILGLSPHSYYHNPRSVLSDNRLLSNMSYCQRLNSSLPNQDIGFQQQSSAIIYTRGGKSLSSSPSLCQQTGGMLPDPHRSVLVHTGSPAQSTGSIIAGQHPSIIQFSHTNHQLLQAGEPQTLITPQPDTQQIIFCDGYSPQAATAHSPTPIQTQVAVSQPQHYSTVIQQQQIVQKGQLKNQVPSRSGQTESPVDGQKRVTVKEENLDQIYLDDGECKLILLYSVSMGGLVFAVHEEKRQTGKVIHFDILRTVWKYMTLPKNN